jgi:hypothetical protein
MGSGMAVIGGTAESEIDIFGEWPQKTFRIQGKRFGSPLGKLRADRDTYISFHFTD